MAIPDFFLRTDLPGVDYRKSAYQRWWEYSLEDERHPQDPLTRGPGGERASPPPWAPRHRGRSRPSLSAEIDAVQREIAETMRMVKALIKQEGG